MYVCIYIYIYAAALQKIKQKTENGFPSDFPYSVYPFAHLANISLLLVRLSTKKQKNVIRLQKDSTDLPICAKRLSKYSLATGDQSFFAERCQWSLRNWSESTTTHLTKRTTYNAR
jgi:hypothetical protein